MITRKVFAAVLMMGCLACTNAGAQHLLTLDSCRAMALRNNKQLGVARLKQDVATNLRKSARTKYLPHVSAVGTYQFTSKEMSLLNDDQKASLSSIGTNLTPQLQGAAGSLGTTLQQFGQTLAQLGVPAAQVQQMMGNLQSQVSSGMTNAVGLLNTEGQKVVDAFRTDTRNIWAGSILLTQPVFMGGAITALNKLAALNEQMETNSMAARRQAIAYATDQTYWQVVSLVHKKRLAESYLEVVKKLDHDVQRMIEEGVATRSDGLSVSVKVSEAEMALQRVDDGLVLSRMLLCQMVGLPLNEQVTLADESTDEIAAPAIVPQADADQAYALRPELKMLETTVDMSRQATNIIRAGNLPQVLLTGGYAISNPNVLNGFEKKFGGFWNVGVLVRVPIWNWGDVMYKVRAAKNATAIAQLELEDAREKVDLQLNQVVFRVNEANKRMQMAQQSISRAEENLRTANLGFAEGVIAPAVVLEAQTAWLQAQSQKIDAAIDVRLSEVDLQKAQGTLLNE